MSELITQLPTAIIIATIVGFFRNFTGWLENVWKDGKIDAYDYKQLAGTVVKYITAIILLMLGVDNVLPILGIDPANASEAAVPISASTAYVIDVVTSAIKKGGAINGK